MSITFSDDNIQKEIIESETNPFNLAFEVDVKIQYKQEHPIAYQIIKLHQIVSED